MADYEYYKTKAGRVTNKGKIRGSWEKPITEKKYEKIKERYEKRGGETYKKDQSTITTNPKGTKSVDKVDTTPMLYTKKGKDKGRDFPLAPTPGV